MGSAMTKKQTSRSSSRSQSVCSDKSQDHGKPSSNQSTPKRLAKNLKKKLIGSPGVHKPTSPGTRKPRTATEHSLSALDVGGKSNDYYFPKHQIKV